MDLQSIKQRFGIIGNSPLLNRAIEIAIQIAPTDVSVLITGESGTGKEFFPQIIHSLSHRKHAKYFAINCGAIPEGTIDSELFGHEKGAFTSAHETRKGYFEVANGGTIFLDEVAELPLSTQVRLLRVLETGEFLKVGSSNIQKTNVRIVAATNVDMQEAIFKNKFREDLFYRLNTVPIKIPPLRERKEDILLLFRKFISDFSNKYRIEPVTIDNNAKDILLQYRWPGNVRELRNIAEQILVIEKEKVITPEILMQYIPINTNNQLPVHIHNNKKTDFSDERELLFKFFFDIKTSLNEIKLLLSKAPNVSNITGYEQNIAEYNNPVLPVKVNTISNQNPINIPPTNNIYTEEHNDYTIEDERLSIQEKENELIIKALKKNNWKKNKAAKELGISERTLYRKIKEYNIPSKP